MIEAFLISLLVILICALLWFASELVIEHRKQRSLGGFSRD